MPKLKAFDSSRRPNRRRSLASRVIHATVLNLVILGVVALLVGLIFYTIASAQQYISLAYGTARSAVNSVTRGADAEALCRGVMEVYHSLTPEERAHPGTPEYRERFRQLKESMDYDVEWHILKGFVDSSGVFDVYLGMYDRKDSCLVYITDPDPDPETALFPGDWESVNQRGLERFLNGETKNGMLYDVGYTELYGWICTAAVPLRDKTGEIYAFLLADVTMAELFSKMWSVILQFSMALLAVTALIALISYKRVKSGLVQPINEIAEAALRYSEDKRAGRVAADHFSALNIRTGDEIENLSHIMTEMEKNLSEYEENLTSVTAEKERIATELNMAAAIQTHMLPSTFPAFPDRPEFSIYATMTPAKEVGGDFYDFFMVDEDHLALVMADVSGKGVPAALFMMTCRTMLKDAAQVRMDPAQVLERVNAQLCEHNPDYMFVTVWIGILEISTGMLTWADAGHEQLMLLREGTWTLLPRGGGVALGAFEPELLELEETSPFRNRVLQLQPGDGVFQYTDGVTEAMTEAREQFGQTRLLETLNTAPSAAPEELLPHVRARIEAFVQGAAQFDDITMLALQYLGKTEERG